MNPWEDSEPLVLVVGDSTITFKALADPENGARVEINVDGLVHAYLRPEEAEQFKAYITVKKDQAEAHQRRFDGSKQNFRLT